MEAFGVSVLPRAAEFNVKCFDAQRCQPLLDCLADKLSAVVAANMLRYGIDGK
jgi:hypothetical protein